jgi:hypothetical protein
MLLNRRVQIQVAIYNAILSPGASN